ncbi:glycosyltransferase family 2 protein [Gramella sp. AN32]|uniref:Glycosyltransferase family 2 protein n=1 Tax=Christiangramia antarctica TaxID=2058158 RepID=A0ABW5X6I6_9FLAO|nr:glycosyltransferase family 2 protein [Gramella sp. AN32]MCM4154704.1 glycosyltransferase [Gramella sp. AN32]
MSKLPLISIITVNLNDLEGLKNTMTSVSEQTWQEFEFIVIDGGSTDGSKEYLESHQHKIDLWVSEPDRGIYNAMNKGIGMASGEYLLFLNSGDSLCNEDILSKVSRGLSAGLDIYYGNVFLIGKGRENELLTLPEKLSFSFFCVSTITHQAAFIKKSLFESISYYNEDYRLVSDWEFFICAICKYNSSYYHLDMPVVNYDNNGLSSGLNFELLLDERNDVLTKKFPLFMSDYFKMVEAEQKIKSKRFQAFSKLETKTLARKINSVLFKLFKCY